MAPSLSDKRRAVPLKWNLTKYPIKRIADSERRPGWTGGEGCSAAGRWESHVTSGRDAAAPPSATTREAGACSQ